MCRIIRPAFSAGIALAVIFSTLSAWAAITGSISGVVTDPSGAVVPGVTVVATAVSTNVQSKAVTDAKGFYNLPTLQVDTYNISTSQAGFRDYQQTGIKIDANSALRVDITLQLGTVTNTVNVKSDALQVETQSTQNGVLIDGTKITSVPLNGRSYIDLLKLQPGVSPYSHSQDSTTSGIGATQVSGDLDNGQQSVNGGRSGSNAFMVNGANAEEGVHNGAAMIPNLDSIAQFRIITNNFDAEYGNYSGGQINVVTKSGTNQIHGTVFDFLRNTDLDARNYYSESIRRSGRGPDSQEQDILVCRLSGNAPDFRRYAKLSRAFQRKPHRRPLGLSELPHWHSRRIRLGQHSFPNVGISRNPGGKLLHSRLHRHRNLRLSQRPHSPERVVAGCDEHAEVRPRGQRSCQQCT
jgi:hypothetical protein